MTDEVWSSASDDDEAGAVTAAVAVAAPALPPQPRSPHGSQRDAPARLVCDPCGQVRQLLYPASAYRPIGQAAHGSLPPPADVPSGHASHISMSPITPEKPCPCLHPLRQVDASTGRHLPKGQRLQVVVPNVQRYVSSGQWEAQHTTPHTKQAHEAGLIQGYRCRSVPYSYW